ncbi:acyl-CoA dehydrogenase family protein [Streptomyces sp. H10-C2]|uniref:acyl-CoA dehydrogenase family protein n=1 Tax=unclassified Streptomyces TaxID=2593676 RepID=UPI0024BB4477|nr:MULTISPECIES: acyl-CoA dehydrogenase family protein [unclassified Streptomyces]MDJ0342449.1 acyl-CoA dehydrogenase family protein [Streptomyces sp. PH10-H1]MDJ0372304.1 acyl-CoA dehydrogenase family protein [Streptomyces sp. H10-C2]
MDFQPTEDQEALRTGVRKLLAGRFPREALRAAVDAGDVPGGAAVHTAGGGAVTGAPRWPTGTDGGVPLLDRARWRELGAAGFFALRVPEADGGVGLGLPEAVLLFEEAGRVLLPGPLVATHLAATHLTGPVAAGAATGETVVTLAQPSVPVGHLAAADAVMVLGGTGDGSVGLVAADAFPAVAIRSVDPLTPLHLADGGPGGGLAAEQPFDGGTGADPDRLRREAALLTAAQQVGSAGRTLAMAVQHAREREQFGRPIGAFQAVKHLCADMLVRVEMARTAVYAAAVSGDGFETAAARLLADDAAARNARDCLQVFGGMGFTWEADVHLHIKRSWVLAAGRGDKERYEEELAGELLR